jgi:septation ring formation regulator EzrA
MSRWLIGMSGDKDKMIDHLLKCEDALKERLGKILAHTTQLSALVKKDDYSKRNYTEHIDAIMKLCNAVLDRRSAEEKQFDALNESLSVLEQQMSDLQSVVRAFKEQGGDE